MNPTESMLQEAAHWHALASGRTLSASENAALDAWLEADLHHRLAYADIAAAGFALEQALPTPLRPQTRPARSRARWMWLGATAPVLLLLLVLAGPRVVPTWQNLRSDLYSAIGKPQTHTLGDGSVITLDTDTAVRVRLGEQRRDIQLLRGRLAISVAKDTARPLHVLSTEADAIAVGTRYVVDQRDGSTLVSVSEGIVRVEATQGTLAQVLSAGQRVQLDRSGQVISRASVAVTADGWSRGVLSVDHQPLAQVLAELDRYLPETVVLRSSDRADTPITANLPLDDPRQALAAVAQAGQLSLRHIPHVAYILQ